MPAAEALLIRPIEPSDKQSLADAFKRLSPGSRYLRFLAPQGELNAGQLRYLTEVDHHDHEALVAYDARTGEGVGVARFVRLRDDPQAAELAVAVADEWQGQGVGSRLVNALTDRAREEGIRRFTALMLSENAQMRSLLDDIGEPRVVQRDRGTVELAVDLPRTGIGRIAALLRGVARGELTALMRRREAS